MPGLRVEEDIDREVEVFVSFLHHKTFPGHKKKIFKTFPQLESALEGVANADIERRIVKGFIQQYRLAHPAIEAVVRSREEQVRLNGQTVLREIAHLMDYHWPASHEGYTIIPTILPFSPFRGHTVYFSVLRFLNGRAGLDDHNHDILPLLAHEVSHLILRDRTATAEEKEYFEHLGQTTMHFLQEIFAPILMNQEPVRSLLGVSRYLGNPYLETLNIESESRVENIVTHFTKLYEKMRIEHKPFIEIVRVIANELESVAPELEKKLTFWNEHSREFSSDPSLRGTYETPIHLYK